MGKKVVVERAVVDSILSYAQMFHPRESILLLKGKADKNKIPELLVNLEGED